MGILDKFLVERDRFMIANQHEKGWEVIYHRAHALLAAQLAGHWNAKDRPIRWLETIDRCNFSSR